MGIDLSTALHDLARSAGDDAATGRMSSQVHHMVARVKRRRATRQAATGLVGVGAVGAVAVFGPWTGRPDPAANGDPWGTGLAIGSCGSPAPAAASDGRGLHFAPEPTGSTTVPVGGPLELELALVNDGPDPFRAGTSVAPSAVVVQGGVVVGQGDPMIEMLQMVDLAPGERLDQQLWSSLTACGQDGDWSEDPLPPGEYEVYAMQVFHPDAFMDGGMDGDGMTLEGPQVPDATAHLEAEITLAGLGGTDVTHPAPPDGEQAVPPVLPGTLPGGDAVPGSGAGSAGDPGTHGGVMPPDGTDGDVLPPDGPDGGVPTVEPVTVVGGPWTITIDGSLPPTSPDVPTDPDGSVSWPPAVDPAATFPECYAEVPTIHQLPPTHLTVVTDVPESLLAGEPWDFTAYVGTTDGRTVIANLAERATLLFTLNGVVVGHLDFGGDVVDAEITPDATYEIPGRAELLGCSPAGGTTPLPPGEYSVFTVLQTTLKEVTTAEGEASAPQPMNELAVSNPTLVRLS